MTSNKSLTAWFASVWERVVFWLAMAFLDDFKNEFVPRSPVSPFGFELDNIVEDHGVSLQNVDGAAFQRNRLSQHCRDTIDARALSFCGILPLQLTCRLSS